MKGRPLLGMAVGLVLLLAPLVGHKSPLFIWNASPSVPTGLYWVGQGFPRVGDLVVVRLPPAIAALAARRGYLPRSAYLLKPVAALAGDYVCRVGDRIFVRSTIAARALATDALDRALPAWRGCRRLLVGEIFVLAHETTSFDSRYFGPILTKHIIGRAMTIWPPRSLNRVTSN